MSHSLLIDQDRVRSFCILPIVEFDFDLDLSIFATSFHDLIGVDLYPTQTRNTLPFFCTLDTLALRCSTSWIPNYTRNVEGTYSGQFGYIIAAVSILDIGRGWCFNGEVVDGMVNNVNKVGGYLVR